MRAEIHIQMLKGSSLNTVAFRQLTVRAECAGSWFAQVRRVAALYELETEALAAAITRWSKKGLVYFCTSYGELILVQ